MFFLTHFVSGCNACNSDCFTSKRRRTLVDWILEINICDATKHLAVALLDNFFARSTKKFQLKEYQAITAACIFIASKFESGEFHVSSDFIIKASDNHVTYKKLIEYEKMILSELLWDIYRFFKHCFFFFTM